MELPAGNGNYGVANIVCGKIESPKIVCGILFATNIVHHEN